MRASRRDILDWILREGFRNTVMDEYLAYLAASRGDLLAALSADDVDDELLNAAGGLLMALLLAGQHRTSTTIPTVQESPTST